ncbi:Caspase domain-containing protein [Lutibacter agarilyticus]|uniref:Caspase domain-containing protein n=1 Tax=Lutibacter agarilyticus TaxID=1109740 RepID=A0A238XWW6_9FLAO|nr:caspase family protein [Lutibacter agarilyticus]SNR63068.1 Caspase domain-containing protein [Lutibacter agarilyticus]
MKKIILLLFILFSLQIQAKKRALIIAVGDYPKESKWGAISSVNDVPLIKNSLLNNGFLEEDIVVLLDANATKQGILTALETLQSKSGKGDIIVIHYSGHGQQIFDDNGDEIDGKDESIVPYDAFARYSDIYKGQNHLRDDEIGNIITGFRNKLGKKGQLLVILDSCHSGSATRGGKARGGQPTFAPLDWVSKSSEKAEGSAMFEKTKLDKDPAPFIMITGASADELNYEYEGFGSLSYAFSKAMTDLGTDFTYRQLFSKINANMLVITPRQTPTIEGDIDYKLFKGEYVAQQLYFEINQITKPDIIQVNAGKLNGLFNNTTVFIAAAGTSKVDASNAISTGTITNANFNSATIKLDNALADTNYKKYWVFVDKPSYGDDDYALKVFIDDKTVTDKSINDGVTAYLTENQLGEIVLDSLKSDVIITKEKSTYVLNSSKGIVPIDGVPSSRGTQKLDLINEKLFNYAHGQYLKGLSLKNHDYEFEFKLLPVEFNQNTNKVEVFKSEDSFYSSSGIFEVNTNDSYVVLQVTNKSDRPVYFSIIEINSKGEINPFMPNNNCTLNNNERKLEPGKTMVFKDCVYSFGPPYERLLLKGFATSAPVNFQPTVETRGEGGVRAGFNPLEDFIKQSYTKSRGSEGNNTSNGVDGYTTEFVYEIIK